MRLARWMMTTAMATLAGISLAVGVANEGTYRSYSGERAPAEPDENVRIIPPPTGGNLTVRIRTSRSRYHVGDPIQVFFGVNRDAHVFIYDTDASGITRQIFPNYYDTDNFIRAGKTYYIPDRGYDLEVDGPQGREELVAVAVVDPYPLLNEYRIFSKSDPYPVYRDGAAGLVRRIETFRREPSAMEIRPVRPVPKENLYASDDTSFYVMGTGVQTYKVPRFGSLDLDTYPNNARFYIDGKYNGRSPQVVDRLEVGYHRLLITKEGYMPYEGNFYITANQTKHLDLYLKMTPIEPGYSRSQNPMAGQSPFGFFQPADPCPPQ